MTPDEAVALSVELVDRYHRLPWYRMVARAKLRNEILALLTAIYRGDGS